MIEYQRIVDDVRSAMYSATADNVELLRSAIANYARLCSVANDRLRRCDALLKRGLRSEALQQAEIAPNLDEVVATLDFPDRAELTRIAYQFGLAPPPELLIDEARELNEAYAIQGPLEALLREHRLQAIAQAPLKARLRTLRSLCTLDANNLAWQEDLDAYERERQKQIQVEADAATRAGRVDVLEDLIRELKSTPWRSASPRELKKSIRARGRSLQHRQAMQELQQLEPQLNDAFANFDVATGRALRERWEACMAICELPETDPLVARAVPALEWLAGEDEDQAKQGEHEAALTALERALESSKPKAATIERYYHAAVRHGHGIPPAVEQRYHAVMQGLEFAARRRFVMTVAAVGAGIVLVTAAIVVGVWSHRQRTERDSRIAVFAQLIDGGKLDEAQRYLDDTKFTAAHIAANSRFQELAARLASLQREEQLRVRQFQTAMDRVETAGLDRPDHEALKSAENLSRTPEEKATVAEAKAAIARRLREIQADRDKKFLDDVAALAAHVKQLEGQMHATPTADNVARQLNELQAQLAAIQARSNVVSESARLQLRPVAARLKSLQADMDSLRQEYTALDALRGAIGNADRYAAALGDYVKKFPESGRAQDFTKVVDELSLVKGIMAWSDFAMRLRVETAKGLRPEAAKALVQQANGLLGGYAAYPQAAPIREFLPHLRAVESRADSSGQPLASVEKLFKRRLIDKCWVIDDMRGRKYYVLEQDRVPDPFPSELRFSALVDFSGEKRTQQLLARDTKRQALSPQGHTAKEALAAISDYRADARRTTWEVCFARIFAAILNQADMEPILKIDLLKETVDVACKGSIALQEALEPESRKLKQSAVNTGALWMSWDEKHLKDVTNARAQAERELDELKQVAAKARKVAEARPTIANITLDAYDWIGFLFKPPGAEWTCISRADVPPAGELFVARQLGEDEPIAMQRIGRRDAGQISINATRADLLVEGRPVYILLNQP